jgi:phosphoglycolate phosphatase
MADGRSSPSATGPSMRYSLVIFDFDGTLSDSFPWFFQAMNRAALKFHFKQVSPEDLERFRGYSPRQMMVELDLSMWKLPLIARHMRSEMRANISQMRLFAGVREMLEALEGRVRIAIVTSNSLENVRLILGEESFARVQDFECEVSAFGKGRRLAKLLKKTGMRPEDAVFIGDEIRDAEAARAAGVAFLGVSWGYASAAALGTFSSSPILESPASILRFLAGDHSSD